MKHSGFGIIELLRNNIPPEAHAMNNSITQDSQNDNQISKTIVTVQHPVKGTLIFGQNRENKISVSSLL